VRVHPGDKEEERSPHISEVCRFHLFCWKKDQKNMLSAAKFHLPLSLHSLSVCLAPNNMVIPHRRRILIQLNKGESRHSLARVTYFGQKGEVRQRYREGQEEQLGALGFVVNAMVLWNTLYMNRALEEMQERGMKIASEDVERLSPLGYDHINLLGRYTFSLSDEIRQGAFHPLREFEETEQEPEASIESTQEVREA
jgi:hypothetical protein